MRRSTATPRLALALSIAIGALQPIGARADGSGWVGESFDDTPGERRLGCSDGIMTLNRMMDEYRSHRRSVRNDEDPRWSSVSECQSRITRFFWKAPTHRVWLERLSWLRGMEPVSPVAVAELEHLLQSQWEARYGLRFYSEKRAGLLRMTAAERVGYAAGIGLCALMQARSLASLSRTMSYARLFRDLLAIPAAGGLAAYQVAQGVVSRTEPFEAPGKIPTAPAEVLGMLESPQAAEVVELEFRRMSDELKAMGGATIAVAAWATFTTWLIRGGAWAERGLSWATTPAKVVPPYLVVSLAADAVVYYESERLIRNIQDRASEDVLRREVQLAAIAVDQAARSGDRDRLRAAARRLRDRAQRLEIYRYLPIYSGRLHWSYDLLLAKLRHERDPREFTAEERDAEIERATSEWEGVSAEFSPPGTGTRVDWLPRAQARAHLKELRLSPSIGGEEVRLSAGIQELWTDLPSAGYAATRLVEVFKDSHRAWARGKPAEQVRAAFARYLDRLDRASDAVLARELRRGAVSPRTDALYFQVAAALRTAGSAVMDAEADLMIGKAKRFTILPGLSPEEIAIRPTQPEAR